MRILLYLSIFFSTLVFPQANPSIEVGQSMNQVIQEMKNDDAAEEYNVKKTGNTITVSVKAESYLDKNAIVQYFFKNDILIKKKMTSSVPNPDGMLAFIYQNHVTNNGEPTITKVEGNRAYLWKFRDKVGYYYYFNGYSDWFQRKCFISVITLNKI